MIIKIEHARAIPGVCSAGMRRYAQRLGIDWGDFVRNGAAAERFTPLADDHYIKQILRNAADGRI